MLLLEKSAMSATPSIQIDGVESLQNSLPMCKVWTGLVCTDGFTEIQ